MENSLHLNLPTHFLQRLLHLSFSHSPQSSTPHLATRFTAVCPNTARPIISVSSFPSPASYLDQMPLLQNISPLLHLPTEAPLIVLPSTHLFPNTLLPLYIFEPRYQSMLRWSLENNRVIGLATAKPENPAAFPHHHFHHSLGLGLIRASVTHKDGTSQIMLLGIARIQITDFIQEKPFYIAKISPIPAISASPTDAELLTRELLTLCSEIRSDLGVVSENLKSHLAQIDDPNILSDVVAHAFLRDSSQRQELLEEPSPTQRIRLLLRYLQPATT